MWVARIRPTGAKRAAIKTRGQKGGGGGQSKTLRECRGAAERGGLSSAVRVSEVVEVAVFGTCQKIGNTVLIPIDHGGTGGVTGQ